MKSSQLFNPLYIIFSLAAMAVLVGNLHLTRVSLSSFGNIEQNEIQDRHIYGIDHHPVAAGSHYAIATQFIL